MIHAYTVLEVVDIRLHRLRIFMFAVELHGVHTNFVSDAAKKSWVVSVARSAEWVRRVVRCGINKLAVHFFEFEEEDVYLVHGKVEVSKSLVWLRKKKCYTTARPHVTN
jgi:hypothetical protein